MYNTYMVSYDGQQVRKMPGKPPVQAVRQMADGRRRCTAYCGFHKNHGMFYKGGAFMKKNRHGAAVLTAMLMCLTLSVCGAFSGCSRQEDDVQETASQTAQTLSAVDPENPFEGMIAKSKEDYLKNSDLPEVIKAVDAKESAMADMPDFITIKGVEYSTDLTSLTLSSSGLENEDIVDLKYMIYLTDLQIFENNISDLECLRGLTRLTNLAVFNNEVSDLEPLSGLENMQSLCLRENHITDISPLKNMKNLTNLDISFNEVTNISVLSEMTNMRLLKLNDNKISNISPLSGMVSMDRVHLQNNSITNISVLSGMTEVTEIYLENNNVKDLTPLTELKSLGWLKLSGNPIDDLSPIYGLADMRKLYISGITLKNTDEFNELEFLQESMPECTIVR